MNGRETRLSTAPVVFNPEESLNKYLLNISQSDLIADVESFTGEEALSSPYRYTIRFTSTTDDAEAFHIVQKEASFILRANNPAWSTYFPDSEKWVALRKIPGVITEICRISSSANETLYEAVLEHPLALLNVRYRSAIYQNVSVPELAMAYDLAIGPCKSFDYEHGAFWRELIALADWRSWSTDSYARNYYRTGDLRFETTKKFMNKPDMVLPTGEFGVVNQFMNATRVIPARYPEVHNREVANLQWPMPPVEGFNTVPSEPKRKVG